MKLGQNFLDLNERFWFLDFWTLKYNYFHKKIVWLNFLREAGVDGQVVKDTRWRAVVVV